MNPRELHLLERKGKSLVLFPLPLQGHINPMLQLANIFYSRGFSITIIHTEFNTPTPSNNPHFTFHAIPDFLTKSQASVTDPVALHTLLNANCVTPFRDGLTEMLSGSFEEPIACLITDAMWHFSQAVADELRIPRLVLRTTSVCSFLAWDTFPLLLGKGYLPHQGVMDPRELHMRERKGKRVVLFPLPAQGHINPMLQLAYILYSRGFSITIIHTDFNAPNPSNHPHFTFHTIPHLSTKSRDPRKDVVAAISLLNANCMTPFRDVLAEVLSCEEPIVCLIRDALWHLSQAVADDLRIPTLVLRPASLCSFLAWHAFPFLRQKGYLPQQESQLEDPVAELPPLKVKDLPMIKTHKDENFYDLLLNMFTAIRSSSGLIWNTFQDLEQSSLLTCQRDFPVPSFAVGPFHKYFPEMASSSSSILEQDQSAISWLNTQAPNSVIYVSFGSVSVKSEAEFLEIAWGLANSHQPFLWVVRPGSVLGSEWLGPLPKGFLENLEGRCHIVKWAPQLEVLRHPAVAVFWTHTGWNSTMESICEGIPMICSPSFGDQLVNSRYVSDVWRVGVHLEGKLERQEIEIAIRKVMMEASGKDMKERIMTLKMQAEQCLMTGGSSNQSLERLVEHILSL